MKETTAEVMRTRAFLDGSFIGLKTQDNMAEKMYNMFKGYAQIALPSTVIQDRIEDIDKDKLKSLKDTLKAAKLALKSTK